MAIQNIIPAKSETPGPEAKTLGTTKSVVWLAAVDGFCGLALAAVTQYGPMEYAECGRERKRESSVNNNIVYEVA